MINKTHFINKILRIEKVLIHIYTDKELFLEDYSYVRMMPDAKNTVKDLKIKRLNDYLKGYDYSIIHTSPLDVFPECYRLMDVREVTYYHLLKGEKK